MWRKFVFQQDEASAHHAQKAQAAQLPQSNHVTSYVSKFVLCFTSYGSEKGFKQQKWLRSFKGIGNDAIR